jgi:hypothetical protein
MLMLDGVQDRLDVRKEIIEDAGMRRQGAKLIGKAGGLNRCYLTHDQHSPSMPRKA